MAVDQSSANDRHGERVALRRRWLLRSRMTRDGARQDGEQQQSTHRALVSTDWA
jgi:hypothetical protein